MLTGTPLDLTPFGAVLKGIGLLYWALAALALFVAFKYPTTRRGKGLAAVVAVFAFGLLPASHFIEAGVLRFKRSAAWSHFQERCRGAGETIVRRENDVEGIYLIKVRPRSVNYDEQFTADDVYGHDVGGEDYIRSFLRVTRGLDVKNERGESLGHQYGKGYAWVEAADPRDGKLYRFTLAHKVVRKRSPQDWAAAKKNYPRITDEIFGVELERTPIAEPSARYGLTWDDVSTREDRQRWVAGGVLRVIELRTGEVIAERRGFMWDRGMGSRAGGRSPWGDAEFDACPPFSGKRGSGTRARTMREGSLFVQYVLRPDS